MLSLCLLNLYIINEVNISEIKLISKNQNRLRRI